MEIPPINSLIYEFDFESAKIPPIYKNFENKSTELKSSEKITSKIIGTKDCNSKSPKKVRNHVLKNHEVDRLIKVRIEKGVIATKTFNKIYLNAYENTKLNNPNEIKLLIIPSTEKILKEVCSILITEFNFKINSEKEILVPKMFLPTWQMEAEIK